jgi:hypothetical protein
MMNGVYLATAEAKGNAALGEGGVSNQHCECTWKLSVTKEGTP